MDAYKWAILTAFIWGVVPVLEKVGLTTVKPLVGLFYRCVGVVAGFLFLGLFVLKPSEIKQVDVKGAVFLVISGILASFIAQITFYHGLKIGDVSKVVPISASYPLIAFIMGILILGESLTALKVAGMVLVVAGIALLKI